jgi:hypothetical protein
MIVESLPVVGLRPPNYLLTGHLPVGAASHPGVSASNSRSSRGARLPRPTVHRQERSATA